MVLDQLIVRTFIFPLGIIIESVLYVLLSVNHAMTDVPIGVSSSKVL